MAKLVNGKVHILNSQKINDNFKTFRVMKTIRETPKWDGHWWLQDWRHDDGYGVVLCGKMMKDLYKNEEQIRSYGNKWFRGIEEFEEAEELVQVMAIEMFKRGLQKNGYDSIEEFMPDFIQVYGKEPLYGMCLTNALVAQHILKKGEFKIWKFIYTLRRYKEVLVW